MVKNSYPSLPEIPYKKTSVEMELIVVFAKTLIEKYSIQTIRMAYAIFRNESANGKAGVNHNYAGIQADVGQWKNLPGLPIGTSVKIDNAGDKRRFLCFDEDEGYKVSFELLCIKVSQRKMITANDYFDKWVCVKRLKTKENLTEFQSLLNSASKIFY